MEGGRRGREEREGGERGREGQKREESKEREGGRREGGRGEIRYMMKEDGATMAPALRQTGECCGEESR